SEHLVPSSQCVECSSELLPKLPEFGFCRKHGVAECVLDHPELAQVQGGPQLPKYDTVRALARMARPENNSKNMLHKQRVQFSSAESAARFGIDVDVVQERPMSDVVTANGELTFDPTRLAHLASRVQGTVAAMLKTMGDEVRSGDVLLLVDAARVGEAKARCLQSVVQLDLRRTTAERLRVLAKDKLVTAKALNEAEAALQEAEINLVSARQSLVNLGFDVPDEMEKEGIERLEEELHFLDIPANCLSALPAGAKTTNLIPLRAPYDGVVLSSDVVAGEVVETTKVLLTVADPRRLWLLLNVRPVDAHTRTLQVRVLLNNADGRLRGQTFGSGTIVVREEPNTVVVPAEAVQSTGDARFIFVRDKDYLREGSYKLFHVRQVRTGARDGEYVELLAGALPGEVLATQGSAAILAQLLRSNLGAGCDCHN
ncbi:MAG: hypothetical protein B7Z73_19860, partial [Planctomycetia bacterium 21-64-5]